MATDLYICIVNWKTADLVIDSLASIEPERAATCCHVVVVDNHSGDGSLERIGAAVASRGWGSWVEVVDAGRNGGFAAGNNVAIRAVLARDPGARFLLLLNPDTVVRPGALRILLDFMLSRPQVGIAGGSSEDPDGTRQHCCFRFPSVLSEFAGYLRLGIVDRLLQRWITTAGLPVEPTPVGWVSGAHMMIRREVIDSIGLLDEGYFLYFEETDFTLRAARAGWPCWHVPASRVVHLVGQSSGVENRGSIVRRLPAYWWESRRRYFTLNHGRPYAMLADVAAMSGYALWRIRRFIERRPGSDPPGFLPDLLSHGALRHGAGSLKPRQTVLQAAASSQPCAQAESVNSSRQA